ncbi:hypothetical protein ACWGSK_06825 [Nocardiopsis sp. NPDC055551]|uniref:hypothetical protein n=1 Tax=Nocardiopsis sp. NPDC006832 TaxID=3157188 RepID=UPI0033C24185
MLRFALPKDQDLGTLSKPTRSFTRAATSPHRGFLSWALTLYGGSWAKGFDLGLFLGSEGDPLDLVTIDAGADRACRFGEAAQMFCIAGRWSVASQGPQIPGNDTE